MSDVKSKNLYELLGNDHEYDSDKEPEPPTKAIEKPAVRMGKRDAPKVAPAEAAGATSGRRGGDRRRGGFTGNERAFRDRATGRNFNRDQPTGENDDGSVKVNDNGTGSRRANQGRGGPRKAGDRHFNRSGQTDHVKQGDQAWGAPTGESEWNDEKAGEAIAKQEVKEGGWDANDVPPPIDGETTAAADAPEPEPEDTNKSYAEYLAEQAAKKLEGLGLKEARAPNEGSKENKKWKSAKELTKDQENEDYFKGEERARRERERSHKKNFIDIDYTFKEPARESRGEGRGGRGGRGRGRGDRGDRPSYRGRGSDRGDRGDRGDRPERGSFRGRARGGDAAGVAVNDESAFPSLGGK